MTHKTVLCSTLALGAAFVCGALTPANAEEETYTITIRDHRFEPDTLALKAGVKTRLVIENAQKEAAEFESGELNREKVIPPGAQVSVSVGPLAPGSYAFFDDFHQETTGKVVVK
ncbi:MAG: cupredoxin domain-containing protein [Hyphomicrobiaceae bacterium]